VRPNHKDECDGKSWRYSGTGYNRVKLCACGAEDHAPDGSAWKQLADVLRPEYAELAELRRYRDKTEAALHRLCSHVCMTNVAYRVDIEYLGLWREPPKDGGA